MQRPALPDLSWDHAQEMIRLVAEEAGSRGVPVCSIGVSGAMTGAEDAELAQLAVDKIDFILANYW